MSNSFPKAKDVLPDLMRYADTFSRSNSHLTLNLDIDKNGKDDTVEIIPKEGYYEFKVYFNTLDPEKEGVASHSYFAPYSPYKRRLNHLNLNPNIIDGYSYLQSLSKKYDKAKVLLNQLYSREYTETAKAFGVLSKSEIFRNEMGNFLKSGGGFTFKDDGYYYNPKKNTFNIPSSDILLALQNIPHELYHRHDRSANAEELSEKDFINIKCQNELNANIFSMITLSEAGVDINSTTFPSLFKFVEAKKSDDPQVESLRIQKRMMNSYGMTYVEFAAVKYRSLKSKKSFDSIANDIRQPYKDLQKWVNWFSTTYLQYYIDHPDQWDENQAPDQRENLERAFTRLPIFKDFVQDNMEMWTGLIYYYVESNQEPDPHGVISMQQGYFIFILEAR